MAPSPPSLLSCTKKRLVQLLAGPQSLYKPDPSSGLPHLLSLSLSVSSPLCTQAHIYTPQLASDSRLIVRGQSRCINSFIMLSELPELTSYALKRHKVEQAGPRKALPNDETPIMEHRWTEERAPGNDANVWTNLKEEESISEKTERLRREEGRGMAVETQPFKASYPAAQCLRWTCK